MEEKEIYEALGLELPQRQDEAPEGAGDGLSLIHISEPTRPY